MPSEKRKTPAFGTISGKTPIDSEPIRFNRPWIGGKELEYITQACRDGRLSGDGAFTKRCHEWMQKHAGCPMALLTHSCTGALEIAALLLNIQPGDEVIMPSFTYPSTANAFALRGATIVFVDIREDTLNLDERLIEEAITPRTRAVVPVHYAGVACAMDRIMELAEKHGLHVVEDAAQGVMADYRGHPLGSIGHLGTWSFHETKNLVAGEGGSLLVNAPNFAARAEVLWLAGTNRCSFQRGETDQYTWCDLGSSFLPGELIAAFLWGQIEQAEEITRQRLELWQGYHQRLEPMEKRGLLRRPMIPKDCGHNAHMYYLLLPDGTDRSQALLKLKAEGIWAVSHYVPLHSSPAGKLFGRVHGSMEMTERQSARLIRLPLWVGMDARLQERIVSVLKNTLLDLRRSCA
ncbi:MAG: dTDP-4-amino-4,6-dideoxygalactose transaminase [Candidatus Eutrophobiaceae bacterium]